jgi:hypothetical protein
LEKLAPATIERAVHAYNALGKYLSNIYLRNEKLLEVVQFVNVLIDNPQMIFESPMKRKNRFEKISTCVNMIRLCQRIESSNIKINGIFGVAKMHSFNQLNF